MFAVLGSCQSLELTHVNWAYPWARCRGSRWFCSHRPWRRCHLLPA